MLKAIKSTLIATSLLLCAGAASAATFVVEAETGAGGDAVFENIHGGYTGTGYINTTNAQGVSLLLFKYINIEPAPTGTVKVRYANGGTTNRPATFYVNEQFFTLQFPPTGGWNVWREATVTSPLIWSSNEFLLTATTSGGLANIDKITIVTP